MKYVFQVSAYDAPELEEELRLALETRGELTAPAPTAPRRPQAEPTEQSMQKSRILGTVMIAVGLLILIIAMLMPDRPSLLLLCGLVTALFGLVVLRSKASTGVSPAHSNSAKLARQLLMQLRRPAFSKNLTVSFSDDGMVIRVKDSTIDVPFAQLNALVETRHLWMVSYEHSGTVLQKKDLTEGDPDAFFADISEKAGCPAVSLSKEEEEPALEAPADGGKSADTTGD